MAELFYWQPLSDQVAIFKLKRGPGEKFPEYKAGQNIELYLGSEAKIYSIVSAPYQTKREGFLEFFVTAEHKFHIGERIRCSDYPLGDFTLQRTENFRNVVFVATGTGIAPFVSMIRELSLQGGKGIRYTVIHGSRKFVELGYYKELSETAATGKLDFVYLPTISRPSAGDWKEPRIGKGRAGNVLRRLLRLSCKGQVALPDPYRSQDLTIRFQPHSTIILACGSHASVADIQNVAAQKGIRFEKEDW